MRTLLLALITFGLTSAAENGHLQFDELRAQARAAVESKDSATAETRYQELLKGASPGLQKGLIQADLGFLYQSADFSSADHFHGENLVEEALGSFSGCLTHLADKAACQRQLAYTAGVQGAMYFQRRDYAKAEPLFRTVVEAPEASVQEEVLLVSLHALRGILMEKKQYEEAEKLKARATAFESAHPNAFTQVKRENSRSRTR